MAATTNYRCILVVADNTDRETATTQLSSQGILGEPEGELFKSTHMISQKEVVHCIFFVTTKETMETMVLPEPADAVVFAYFNRGDI
jgi:hypothetical protein